MPERPRQLRMRFSSLDALPPLAVPDGCGLRTYLPGDEAHWARIMNDCIGENWTAERCLAELVNRPEFTPEACFFATVDGVPEGTATAWRSAAVAAGTGYVHMVGVSPAARGKSLGYLVTLATLHWFHEHRYQEVVLDTDDWRLPAIGVYFKLGFQPVLFDEGHAQRWEAVRRKLAGPR
jgi:mycothiol synthase